MSLWWSLAFIKSVVLLLLFPVASSVTLKVTNNCEHAVWPAVRSGPGAEPLSTTGFMLKPGASETVHAPVKWSGRMWARTLCSGGATGNFTCVIGDWDSARIAEPPATLVEFKLGHDSSGMDLFVVSLADGYNLPMLVEPQGGSSGGRCMPAGCLVDLNGACPADLKVMAANTGAAAAHGGAVACRSACQAFGSPQYCCSGAYGNANACRPSTYSQFFKNACPRAYSYPYDDENCIFTCTSGTNYVITFCPSTTTSGKYSGGGESRQAAGVSSTNDTMVVLGTEQVSATSTAILATLRLMLLLLAVLGLARLTWLRCSNFSQPTSTSVELAAPQPPQQQLSEADLLAIASAML